MLHRMQAAMKKKGVKKVRVVHPLAPESEKKAAANEVVVLSNHRVKKPR